ncbi:heavy metal-associated isoprenylated plant protein 3 isoform X2 [Elaeis guineensis]|uniref:Heavy metal-associated isoprenylated plant protein 3 isoform X2 n=1 Tax=Elaeis guineensis var. tenera TaxID=51953 RepID=A0A6I9SBT4_ELAGV|nr:heavy metal-associated isoprenylated plant protein 3 isoform X2 [Elaeis guineensis]
MGNEKKNGGEREKKDDRTITVVLKVGMYCEGCAKEVKKSVEGFEGVEQVKVDIGAGMLRVVGKVDPSRLRDHVAKKTNRKVDLVSPTNNPQKDAKKKDDPKKPTAGKDSNKSDKKKSKEPGLLTVVLKTHLHCDCYAKLIKKKILKHEGVRLVVADVQKGMIMVTGTMDVKRVLKMLKQELEQTVEVAAVGS